jgi:hypothetical protein
MEFAKAANCKFTAVQILELMVLFPFFAVKNGYNYARSVLGQMFSCQKDMFYRFLSNEDINWRPKSLAKLQFLIELISYCYKTNTP